jgi:hydrogenase maturation protease
VKKTVVLGIGNLLLRDEGAGVHVVSRLMQMDLPENVEVVDGATDPLDILSLSRDVDKLIIVDALQGGGEPGTIYRMSPEDIASCGEVPFSLHQLDLIQMLDMCASIGSRPSTVIIGVEPKEIDFELELSPEVEGKIPRIIELILEEIEREDGKTHF